MKKRIFIPFLGMLSLFFSCKKNDQPAAEGTKLVKIISTQSDSVGVMSFDYDQNDKLTGIFETVNNKNSYQRNFYYDASGKLTGSKEVCIPNNSSWNMSYTYDHDRIVTKVSDDGHGEINKNVYTYNSQGDLIADTFYSTGPQHYANYMNFKYNNSGDVQEMEYFSNYFGAWEKIDQATLIHNNALNPYNGIDLMYYITGEDDENKYSFLGKHLITGITTPSGPVNYQYEYYNNGLVKKVSITSHFNGNIRTSTIEFFYK